jgi:hypothetical protein
MLAASGGMHMYAPQCRRRRLGPVVFRGLVPLQISEYLLDFGPSIVRSLVSQRDGIDHTAQCAQHFLGEIRILRKHRRQGIHGSTLIQKQEQKLFTENVFEIDQ